MYLPDLILDLFKNYINVTHLIFLLDSLPDHIFDLLISNSYSTKFSIYLTSYPTSSCTEISITHNLNLFLNPYILWNSVCVQAQKMNNVLLKFINH